MKPTIKQIAEALGHEDDFGLVYVVFANGCLCCEENNCEDYLHHLEQTLSDITETFDIESHWVVQKHVIAYPIDHTLAGSNSVKIARTINKNLNYYCVISAESRSPISRGIDYSALFAQFQLHLKNTPIKVRDAVAVFSYLDYIWRE